MRFTEEQIAFSRHVEALHRQGGGADRGRGRPQRPLPRPKTGAENSATWALLQLRLPEILWRAGRQHDDGVHRAAEEFAKVFRIDRADQRPRTASP